MAEGLEEADYEEVWGWVNKMLYKAFFEARRGKLKTVNEQKFEENRDLNLALLTDAILECAYCPSRSVAFIIKEPTMREIFAAPFVDRIVHHFLILIVGDWWDRRFSVDSYSCREGKGTLFGIKRLERHMRRVSENWHREVWILKLDLQGYFMSLPRERLFEQVVWGLVRQFPDKGLLYEICRFLWGRVIFDDPTDGVRIKCSPEEWRSLPKPKSLFYAKDGCGIVIGNLTSQWLSNMMLDKLDRFVKFDLGYKSYGRYVDDFYLVSDDRNELCECREKINIFLDGLGLKVHPKKVFLQPMGHGVPFLGVVVYPYRIQVGKRLARNIKLLARNWKKYGENPSIAISRESYKGLVKYYRYRKMWQEAFEQV
jgi:hypothetical protein